MTEQIEVPQYILRHSREWQATLWLLQNTTLSEFFTPDYVDVKRQTIDFTAMISHANTHSQIFLVKLAAHLFNAFGYDMPNDGMFTLDANNLRHAFLAMMIRHGIHPLDLAKLLPEESNG